MNQPVAWIDLGNDSAAVDDSGRLVGVARYIGNTNRPTEPIRAAREPTGADTMNRIDNRIQEKYRKRTERRRAVIT
jgi:hypothetical protein